MSEVAKLSHVSFAELMSSKIFISYRRDDSAADAGRLYDNLVSHFDKVFMDVDYIEPGEDFIQVITDTVSSCQILIAVIGRGWLSSSKDGSTRRLDDPNDFVRLEIATALSLNVYVVPVLVQGATMPTTQDLPDNLIQLSRRQAFELSYMRWKRDVEILIVRLKSILKRQQQEARQAEKQRQREVRAAADAKRKRESEEAARLRTVSPFRAFISKNRLVAVIAALLILTAGASIGVWVKRAMSDPVTQVNRLVSEANNELKEVDKIADDNEQKMDDLDKADKEGDAMQVRNLLDDLRTAIDDGIKHGETAADKLDKASKMNVDDKYKEYLSLKSQSLRKQIEAFKERKEAAKIMHDYYDNPSATAMQKAKDDFKKKNSSFKKLLSEAKDMSRKADDIARQNPDRINPP